MPLPATLHLRRQHRFIKAIAAPAHLVTFAAPAPTFGLPRLRPRPTATFHASTSPTIRQLLCSPSSLPLSDLVATPCPRLGHRTYASAHQPKQRVPSPHPGDPASPASGSRPVFGPLKLIRNDPSEPRRPSRNSVTRARRRGNSASSSSSSLFGFRNSTTETSTAFAEAADAAADAAARQTQKALQLRHLEQHQQRVTAAAQALREEPHSAEAASGSIQPAGSSTSSQDAMSKALSSSVGGANAEHELRRRKDPDSSAKTEEHGHSHAFGHSHSHAHGHSHEGSAEEADKLLAALKGQGDRGSNITLVGLGSNLVLCVAKAVAGVLLHSASLLADAAHSLSDMFSDLVTLFCWRMSRKPPSTTHPLGYGKYETMGGLGVSVVLVAGAVGIGAHSYSLLIEALEPTLRSAPAVIQNIGTFTGALASKGAHLHEHADVGDHGVLDPNAMWFALASVAVKEWLYHATLKVARDENSSVLEANALHHRSDSLSSGVTFLAILGSWLGFPVLDPMGGLLVAGLIGKQGLELLLQALADLSDRGVDQEVLGGLEEAVEGVRSLHPTLLLGVKEIRAVKHGVSTLVDVTLEMPPSTTLAEAQVVEQLVQQAILEKDKGVKEVRVRLDTPASDIPE